MGSKIQQLFDIVLKSSESSNLTNAFAEWDLEDSEEDVDAESVCVCGKENIRYLHLIRNRINGNTLFPIGSSCIEKFERSDLNEMISLKESMFRLFHAVENNEFLSLSKNLFSRKLIKYLYEQGTFTSTQFEEKDSYEFLLKMFNKKSKRTITEKQDKKIKAILLNNIKPYVKAKISKKIKGDIENLGKKDE